MNKAYMLLGLLALATIPFALSGRFEGIKSEIFSESGEDTVSGFYKENLFDYRGTSYTCDSLVIVKGNGPAVQEVKKLISYGTTNDKIDSSGRVVMNLDFESMNSNLHNRILKSTEDNPITLEISSKGGDPTIKSPCESRVNVLR